MENHLDNGGVIFDICLKIKTVHDLKDMVEIISQENTSAYLNEKLYKIEEKNGTTEKESSFLRSRRVCK